MYVIFSHYWLYLLTVLSISTSILNWANATGHSGSFSAVAQVKPANSIVILSSSTMALPKNLSGQLDVLMIDNFDSFTWNLYQQLCLLGADVTVIRNNTISPSVFPLLKINSLVISPGPGHPKTDSGISSAAIQYFQGKVPVLGVCMGLECLVDLYGGEIG